VRTSSLTFRSPSESEDGYPPFADDGMLWDGCEPRRNGLAVVNVVGSGEAVGSLGFELSEDVERWPMEEGFEAVDGLRPRCWGGGGGLAVVRGGGYGLAAAAALSVEGRAGATVTRRGRSRDM
jgi:hypothetical protein